MTEGRHETQWYWAVGRQSFVQNAEELAGELFVVAQGQRELWARVRREIDPGERANAWMGFGPSSGEPTLADCVTVFLHGLHMYGASFNRVMLELARVPVWASYVRQVPMDLCNMVSNPINYAPLPRERYDPEAERQLRMRIQRTLGLKD